MLVAEVSRNKALSTSCPRAARLPGASSLVKGRCHALHTLSEFSVVPQPLTADSHVFVDTPRRTS